MTSVFQARNPILIGGESYDGQGEGAEWGSAEECGGEDVAQLLQQWAAGAGADYGVNAAQDEVYQH